MDSIKKLGEPLRQHFEKILLTLVLIGLAGTVYYLFQKGQEEKVRIRGYLDVKTSQIVKPVKVVELSDFEKDKKRLENPEKLNYSTPHNLFNPVKWQRRPNRQYIKIQSGKEIGPYALEIENIHPLHQIIAFSRAAGTGFWIAVTNEMIPRRFKGHYIKKFASLTTTNTPVFILRDFSPKTDPTEWALELRATGEKVTITREKPYKGVIGYEADLRYPVDNKSFGKMREGQMLRLSGEDYKIVAIKPNEVLLSAVSNDRRYAIPFTSAP